jgi:hypothetical protein
MLGESVEAEAVKKQYDVFEAAISGGLKKQ